MLDARQLLPSSRIDYDHDKARRDCFWAIADYVTTGVGRLDFGMRYDQRIASETLDEAVVEFDRCRSILHMVTLGREKHVNANVRMVWFPSSTHTARDAKIAA